MSEVFLALDAAERPGFVRGLHTLADFLEAHPHLPVPRGPALSLYTQPGSDVLVRCAVEHVAACLGVPPVHEAGIYRAARWFGPLTFEAVAISTRVRDEQAARASYEHAIRL